VIAGDAIGEEGLYEVNSMRKDTTVAEDETYLLEITKD
jgi:hypothetical protein